MKELKPCPFCEGKVEMILIYGLPRVDGIRCRKCGAVVYFSEGEEKTIEKWNKRGDVK